MIKHIAFIMDGNGRFAKQKGMERSYGHKMGFIRMMDIIRFISKTDIAFASFYAFSTENWSRPQAEVAFLMMIPQYIFENYLEEFNKLNIKINHLGRKNYVPESTQKYLDLLEKETINNTGLVVNICFDYGAKEELVQAINKLIKKGARVEYKDIYAELYSKNSPEIDLLIRTSGEYRLSNFMLLQLAYSELYFTDTYWPDFDIEELKDILKIYENRDRRYGKIEG